MIKLVTVVPWLCAWLLLSLLLGQLQLGEIGRIDLMQYWSGAKALLAHQNPYDPAVLKIIQYGQHGGRYDTILMWNPPWIFAFTLALGWFSFDQIVPAVLALSITIYVYAIFALRSHSGRLFSIVGLPLLLFVATFPALRESLGLGQISPLMLLGLVLFIVLRRRSGATSEYLSGLTLSLTMIKPHLLFLLYLGLLLEALRTSRWRCLAGLLGGVVLLSLIPALVEPRVFGWYWQAMQAPPLYWHTPTLGSWLQWVFGVEHTVLRYLPATLVAVWYVLTRFKHPVDEASLVWIVPLSLLASPYGWAFDQLLLLPAGLWLLRYGSVYAVALLLAANLLAIPQFFSGQDSMVWYPVVFLIACWLCRRNRASSALS